MRRVRAAFSFPDEGPGGAMVARGWWLAMTCAVGCVLGCALVARADAVTLRSVHVLLGQLTETDDGRVIVTSGGAETSIPREDVRHIERGPTHEGRLAAEPRAVAEAQRRARAVETPHDRFT